jgi:hypothetical protein
VSRTAQLLAVPGVTAVSESTVGLVETLAGPPGDWSDDSLQATWPFHQIRVPEAWDVVSASMFWVGVVDGGTVYTQHEDLDARITIGLDGPDDHATHVAGLACAKANGVGLVGVAWSCPIVSSGTGRGTDKEVLAAATNVARRPGVRTINISMGYTHKAPLSDRCATQAAQQSLIARAQGFKPEFRRLFRGPIGGDVVWTIAAGNACALGVASPWGLNADLDNVITVAATNSDRTLASFSHSGTGVEVAAPGGVSVPPIGNGTTGVWSTSVTPCGSRPRCATYEPKYGTSMAAPIVAGVAALVRSAHPGWDGITVGACITDTAGLATGTVPSASPWPAEGFIRRVGYVPGSLGLVDARAAVGCDTVPQTVPTFTRHWKAAGLDLDVQLEAPGVLGAVNDEFTWFPLDGRGGYLCAVSPGEPILSGFVSAGRQWNGSVRVASPDCSTRSFLATAAMRVARDWDGKRLLVIAWMSSGSGKPPTIGPLGEVSSAGDHHTIYLEER